MYIAIGIYYADEWCSNTHKLFLSFTASVCASSVKLFPSISALTILMAAVLLSGQWKGIKSTWTRQKTFTVLG